MLILILGILTLDSIGSVKSWRMIFLVEGIITCGIAILSFFTLTDRPETAIWLTEEEKQLACWRLDEDVGQDDWISSEQQTLWHGFKLALKDIKTWILVC